MFLSEVDQQIAGSVVEALTDLFGLDPMLGIELGENRWRDDERHGLHTC